MAFNPVKPFQLPGKNYRRVAVIEILLIFLVLLAGDMAQLFGIDPAHASVTTFLLIPEALYLYVLYQLGKNLTQNLRIHMLMRAVIGGIIICSLAGLNPWMEEGALQNGLLLSAHSLLCVLECYLIALGLQDIYLDKLSLKDRLWGSVAMYLLIAIGWASFFEIFLLLDHHALGVALTPGYETYAEALYFSLCSISGTGTVYTAPAHFMRNLALIEAVWGVLFLVMLIGRVFSIQDRSE